MYMPFSYVFYNKNVVKIKTCRK